jgi:hypothetical protein
MVFSSSAGAPVFAGARGLRRRVVALWPRRWSRVTASATIALCALCVFVWLLTPAFATTATFTEGSEQTFTVPTGVSSVEVSAAGGTGQERCGGRGGKGELVSGELSVMPGETLYVEV